jgi:diguanylate cyclase (GGDEF)-like protein
MSLRKKTILAIAIIFLLTMAVGYIYTHTLFIKGYLNLENQEIDANVRRFQYTLDNEIKYLGKLTNDWAAWDDTYAFMQNPSQEYIGSNLVDNTYSELELNFIFFLDKNGNPVYEKAFDLESAAEIPVKNSIYSYIKNLLEISPISEAGEFHEGVFSNEGSPVIFAARPILNSLDEGPSRGTLIFGKILSEDLFEHIKSSVDTKVTILTYSPEIYESFPQLKENPDFRVDLSQPDEAYSYSLIRDTNNEPIFIVEQILQRNIYQQGLSSRREFLTALVLGCIIAIALAMIALEFGFLRRFSKLINGVSGFGASGKNNQSMILKGKDEISNLSVEMYNALSQLADTQNELTTHLDFEKLLVGISTKFINLPIESIDEGICRLLKVIGEFSKADRGYVRLLRSDTTDIMDVTHEWCENNIPSVKESRRNVQVNHSSWWIKTLQNGKPIIINDVSLMPEEANKEMDLFIKQSIRSLIAIPLIISGEFIGLLGYNAIREKKDWSEQTILLLQVIGAVIANVIDRKRHESKIVLNQNNTSNLNEITRMSISKSSLNAACREISKLLNSLTSSDNSYLILSNRSNGFDIFSAGQKIQINEGKQKVFKELLLRSRSEIIQSANLGNRDNVLFKKNLGETFISIPLSSESANSGIIVFSFNKPHSFSSEEIAFCQQSAAQITLTILKTKALESARQKSEELNALRATIADITSELELQKLFHTLLERAIKLMKADGGDFCMVDEETGGLKVVASINIDKEYVGTPIRYGEGASGRVLATKKTFLIDDYSTWPGRLEIFNETAQRATVLLPLMKGDKVLGTLGIFHSNPDKHFMQEDLHMISLFAQHASIAMENALLFDKVQQMARIDEVTGLLNRRAFGEMGEYEINRAKRLMHPISLAMVDLDNFKQVNDQFSHQVGDEVLREVARLCRDKLRNIDIIGRYGGDEMVILMPETNEEKAFFAMERLRKEIEDTPITVRENQFRITASIGLTSHYRNSPPIVEIMDQADSSLYAAKKDGKNCVRIYKGQNPLS